MLYLKRGNVRCKDMLVSWGADTDMHNKNGETPMSLETTDHPFQRNNSASHQTTEGISLKEPVKDGIVGASKTNQINGFVPNYLQHPELNHKAW